MNHRFLLYVTTALVFIFSCQKKSSMETKANDNVSTKNNVASTTTTSVSTMETSSYFNKDVGAPIDSSTANQWKRNLQQQQSTSRIIYPIAYYLSSDVLRNFVASGAVGVCFYYGKDSLGSIHIVPVGINQEGSVMPTATVATTNGVVSWERAREWRSAYQASNPLGTWAHFWGATAIGRLLNKGGKTVRINLGLDDAGKQQMFFSNGEVSDPGEYEDMTSPCPPYCPKER